MALQKIRPLSLKLDPWERQPAEDEKAWAAFVVFREMGEERSIRGSERIHGRSHVQTMRYVRRWSWQERALAYDRYIDTARVKESREDARQMSKRHAGWAKAAIGVMQLPTEELIKRIESKTLDLKSLSTRELLQLVRACSSAFKDLTSVERVARGLYGDGDPLGLLEPKGATAKPTTLADAVNRMMDQLEARQKGEHVPVFTDDDDDVIDVPTTTITINGAH